MQNNNWTPFLKEEFTKPYFLKLSAFLKEEYATKVIYPKRENVFSCFAYSDYDEMKVVVLGQDPYHQPGQAHGCCFSVMKGTKIPPSLQNIYKELQSDLGYPISNNGCLIDWAKQGVLLLNTVLTVEESKPLSHRNQGWETFTDEVLKKCNEHNSPLVFILWGKNAQEKASLITDPKHLLLKAPHPSPLSAYNGFFGSKPFSRTNEFLIRNHQTPIQWQIEE